MRILIVKLGSIGDIVHTLPSLAAMRRALPDSEISWVVERRSSEILKDNPLLDRLIEVDTKALRRGLMSGEALRVYGFARDALREPASRFLVHQTVPVPAGLHVIRKNLTLVKSALGISVPDDPADFDFPIGVSSEHELEAEAAAAGTEGRYAN